MAIAIIALFCGRKYVGAEKQIHEIKGSGEQAAVSVAIPSMPKRKPVLDNANDNGDFDFRKAIAAIQQGTLQAKERQSDPSMNDQEYREAIRMFMQNGNRKEPDEPMDDQVYREALRRFQHNS